MAYIDVFNGDADGICALLQLRIDQPRSSQLVTGVKRDIALLKRVEAGAGDEITVLDVSLDKNRDGLNRVLAAGAEVFYVDHHFAGEIPESALLNAKINTSADVCTSLLVNGHIQGRCAEWAVVGAFGDNLRKSALSLSAQIGLSEKEVSQFENLGIYLNYNGYGESLDDLHFKPEDLFLAMLPFASPKDFIVNARATFEKLQQGYQTDMLQAKTLSPDQQSTSTAIFILPNESWARRVSGVFSNDLANEYPNRAHAVLTEKSNGNYLVSVRAPLSNKVGADEFCRRFATGGGRAAAAGINDLEPADLNLFMSSFDQYYMNM